MLGEMRRNHFRIVYNAPVTLTFLCICLIATILGVISGGRITQGLFMVYRSSLLSPFTYLRFFTHVFGHSGWSHFFSNAVYLLLVGPMLEEKYGAQVLTKVIVITALITGLINFVLFPQIGLCGASGVVFAFILMTSFTGFRSGEIPLSFILVAVVFLGQQIFEGLFVQDNVSNLSHIIGGLVGATFGFSRMPGKSVRR